MDSRVRGNDKGKGVKKLSLHPSLLGGRCADHTHNRFCSNRFLSGNIAADEGGERNNEKD